MRASFDSRFVRSSKDAGFTLIEVMVVVLILGVLMTVATPSLVGARGRAWDSSAKSTLRSAAATAIMLSEFRSDFTLADPGAMASVEPGFAYVSGEEPSTGPKVVSVDASSPTRWTAAVMSDSGGCFAIVLEAGGQLAIPATTCAAVDVDADVPDAPSANDTSGTGGISGVAVLRVKAVHAYLTGGMVLTGEAAGLPENGHYSASPAGTSSSASFVFNVTEAGMYWLWGQTASFGGSSDSFWIQVDGQPTSGYLWDTGTAVAKAKDRDTAPQGLLLTLQPGQHTITIFDREDGTQLYWLELRPA